MKKHDSIGVMYVFDLLCGNCNEWFRSESEISEPPRHTYCRHCDHSMYDDDDVTYTDYKYVAEVQFDLFTFEVVKVIKAEENK